MRGRLIAETNAAGVAPAIYVGRGDLGNAGLHCAVVTGAVLVSMILSASELRLWTFWAGPTRRS